MLNRLKDRFCTRSHPRQSQREEPRSIWECWPRACWYIERSIDMRRSAAALKRRLCEGRRSACYFVCVRRIGLHRASTPRRSGCLGIAAGFLQVPAKLIAHRGQKFISEVDLVATRSFSSCDDDAPMSARSRQSKYSAYIWKVQYLR